MLVVTLDSNIYDRIVVNLKVPNLIIFLIDQSLLAVLMPRTVSEELASSPFRGPAIFFR